MPEDAQPGDPIARPARHVREHFFVEGEGVLGDPPPAPPPAAGDSAARARAATAPDFRFSRLGPRGSRTSDALRRKVADAMATGDGPVGTIPAGYTYLGQFVDHDLTFDQTSVALGESVSPADLLQGRSPSLDLDSVYGAGPADPVSAAFYRDDRHLAIGKTVKVGSGRLAAHRGFDLPREGDDSPGNPRRALIPDFRNDENLAVAQTHLAMIRFHNRVVDGLGSGVPTAQRFRRARRKVTLHYQWMLRHDYLTRICDTSILGDVFTNGRKLFEVGADPMSVPTMPVEFSVAGFRFGHSMVRSTYDWNAEFPDGNGSLGFLFDFSGTSGFLGGGDLALPSNWIADWRRMYRFSSIGRNDLKPPPREFNMARRIDTQVSPPLSSMPPAAFGGTSSDFGSRVAHLAFRNLTRASMLKLASGQQLAKLMRSRGVPVKTLTRGQVLGSSGEGAQLGALTATEREKFAGDTPLWFYALREAELNGGVLTGVGGRLVAETFHRAMEGSRHSIVRDPAWRPDLGGAVDRFTMMDLLLVAYDDDLDTLAPLGD